MIYEYIVITNRPTTYYCPKCNSKTEIYFMYEADGTGRVINHCDKCCTEYMIENSYGYIWDDVKIDSDREQWSLDTDMTIDTDIYERLHANMEMCKQNNVSEQIEAVHEHSGIVVGTVSYCGNCNGVLNREKDIDSVICEYCGKPNNFW